MEMAAIHNLYWALLERIIVKVAENRFGKLNLISHLTTHTQSAFWFPNRWDSGQKSTVMIPSEIVVCFKLVPVVIGPANGHTNTIVAFFLSSSILLFSIPFDYRSHCHFVLIKPGLDGCTSGPFSKWSNTPVSR